MIHIQGLSKHHGSQAALRNLSFTVMPGSIVGVIGPSGAGKTTLLRCMTGLDTFEKGYIDYTLPAEQSGARLAAGPHPSETLQQVRRHVGLCFQDFQLFPHLSVLGNVTLALQKALRLPEGASVERARKVLARVEMNHLESTYPGSLSGGQKQRVALARALALEPRALLFDEPVSALDPERVMDVVQELRDLASSGTAVVVTSHHLPFIKAVATEVLFLVAGEIIERGPPTEVFAAPKTERLASYLRSCLS